MVLVLRSCHEHGQPSLILIDVGREVSSSRRAATGSLATLTDGRGAHLDLVLALRTSLLLLFPDRHRPRPFPRSRKRTRGSHPHRTDQCTGLTHKPLPSSPSTHLHDAYTTQNRTTDDQT